MSDLHSRLSQMIRQNSQIGTDKSDDLLPYTDQVLAEVFIDEHEPMLRFVPQWGKWMVFDGGRWVRDETYQVLDLVRAFVRRAAKEAINIDLKTARKLLAKEKLHTVEGVARLDRRIIATPDQWDSELLLLNTPDGVYDLRTGERRPHDPGLHMSKITAVAPAPGCPKYDAFLARIFRSSPELIDYMQRVCGLALTGLTIEQVLFFLFGFGANGKSVFVNTISGIMNDYATTTAMETLTASKHDRHPTELADLCGARLVIANETEERRAWAENRVKLLTGGDKVKARLMRQDFFEFTPRFKLLIVGNHRPEIANVNEAMARRLRLVPFAETIPVDERNPNLLAELREEWPGILHWMIEGAVRYAREGLGKPAAVMEATREYLTAEDTLGDFIEECCVVGPDQTTAMGALYENYKKFCEARGENHGNLKQFAQAIRTKIPSLQKWRDPQTRRKGLRGIRSISVVKPRYEDDDTPF